MFFKFMFFGKEHIIKWHYKYKGIKKTLLKSYRIRFQYINMEMTSFETKLFKSPFLYQKTFLRLYGFDHQLINN